MGMGSSARPYVLLGLRIKDLEFNTIKDGKHQYTLVRIQKGKTGPRTVPLIDALPYVKECIQRNHNSVPILTAGYLCQKIIITAPG